MKEAKKEAYEHWRRVEAGDVTTCCMCYMYMMIHVWLYVYISVLLVHEYVLHNLLYMNMCMYDYMCVY